MVKNRIGQLYDYTVGITCMAILVIATVIYDVKVPDVLLMIILIAVAVVIDRFRIRIGGVWISFVSFIEISSFLIFGPIVSGWILFAFIFISDYMIYKKTLRTVFINAGMILSKILIGAIIYNYVSSAIGNATNRYLSFEMLVSVIAFAFSGFIFNYVLLYIQLRLTKDKDMFLSKAFIDSAVWEIASILISIPVALEFTNIYKYSEGNNLLFSVLFIMPVALICFIFSLIRRLIFANTQLKALSEVALTINKYLDLNRIYNAIFDAISSIVSFKGCYIFNMDEKSGMMIPASFRVDNVDMEEPDNFSVRESMLGRVVQGIGALIINNLQKENAGHNESEYCHLYKSCILIPMRRLNKTIGCIGIFSNDENAYNRDVLEFLMILSDQATVAIENAKLFMMSEEEAITDSLTCLYNQRYFYNCIERKIKEYRENPGKMSLILLDIDYFKSINDTYGHLVGDYILKEVAQLIKSCVRKNDIVSRYGGEEFTVILPDMNCDEAFTIAERIRDRIGNNIFSVDGIEIRLTISGGISEYPDIAANAVEMVSYADRAMYMGAKYMGRNRIKVYDQKMA